MRTRYHLLAAEEDPLMYDRLEIACVMGMVAQEEGFEIQSIQISTAMIIRWVSDFIDDHKDVEWGIDEDLHEAIRTYTRYKITNAKNRDAELTKHKQFNYDKFINRAKHRHKL